jgi:hypothetical protein
MGTMIIIENSPVKLEWSLESIPFQSYTEVSNLHRAYYPMHACTRLGCDRSRCRYYYIRKSYNKFNLSQVLTFRASFWQQKASLIKNFQEVFTIQQTYQLQSNVNNDITEVMQLWWIVTVQAIIRICHWEAQTHAFLTFMHGVFLENSCQWKIYRLPFPAKLYLFQSTITNF